MADDDRYRWLDRATAERLLSGESLEASLASAGPEARDQAERLAKTLGALSVDAPPNDAELPGEAAALAAFRKARPTPDTAAVSDLGPQAGRDMGLVRVGGFGRSGSRARPARWGRPLRLGLSAALAVGMFGSVAVAAGAGVLPNPFRDDEPGRPAATVSAAERDPMLASPSPDASRGKSAPSLRPDSTSGGSVDNGSAGHDEAQEDTADSDQGPHSDKSLPGDWRSGLASSCRDMRSGKKLEAERRRALEKAAKGSTTVSQYCEDTLKDDSAASSNSDTGTDPGPGEGDQSGAGDTDGKGNAVTGDDKGSGSGGGGGRGNGSGTGRGDRAATKPTPEPTSFATVKADDPQNEPAPEASDPSYGILPLPTAT